ncbi:HlyD family secretion protein [Rubritalea marina]|uniref:HlyD family secretion protein n=1 Tax=Rubritalea marina TaxID=361055 RepID=UPI000379D35E|nr:HlyD family secretion protein [Rubritalea marina]
MPENHKSPSDDKKAAADAPAEEPKKKDVVKTWTRVAAAVLVALFLGHVLSDKYVPYTANARIEAFIVPLASQVAGRVEAVDVSNNSLVADGETLVQIEPNSYEIAVAQAELELQQASQASESDAASVSTAQSKVVEARANLENAKVKGERIIRLSEQGAASVSRADDARSRVKANEAKLASAISELEKAKSNLGVEGVDNTKVQLALAKLEAARLDLQRTKLVAPSDGVVTNLLIDNGHYANPGAPVMTFISLRDVWIQADMRENSLTHMKAGDEVEVVLDAAPGRVFKGRVRSVGVGVADSANNQIGSLATVKTSQGWLREAQHFPVVIDFDQEATKGFKRAGGQANVIVYTEKSTLLKWVGMIWIRMVSFFSHVY